MPELPEVERARSLMAQVAEGQTITDLQTFEDTIVYTGGITHTDFADAFRGARIDKCLRVGKQLYFTTKDGPTGLVHLGMSGHTFVKGASELLYYRKIRPQDLDENGAPLWPPRYCKLILTFASGEQWAFTDARRLGRIRMVEAGVDPLTVPPLSALGRDAYNDLPSLDDLKTVFRKRTAPIKALLLDQNGPLAGIGNYLVDEMRVLPTNSGASLTRRQLLSSQEIYKQIQEVIGTAVKANADYRAFPKHWIFSVRWGKGKKGETPKMQLENGEFAPVTFTTVGGRTSAVVAAVQKIPKHAADSPSKARGSSASPKKRKKREASLSDSDTGTDQDVEEAVEEDEPSAVAQVIVDEKPTRTPPKRKARTASSSAAKKSPYFERNDSDSDNDQEEAASVASASKSRKRGKAAADTKGGEKKVKQTKRKKA